MYFNWVIPSLKRTQKHTKTNRHTIYLLCDSRQGAKQLQYPTPLAPVGFVIKKIYCHFVAQMEGKHCMKNTHPCPEKATEAVGMCFKGIQHVGGISWKYCGCLSFCIFPLHPECMRTECHELHLQYAYLKLHSALSQLH